MCNCNSYIDCSELKAGKSNTLFRDCNYTYVSKYSNGFIDNQHSKLS